MKAIQANPKTLREIFSAEYVIPEFQRPYRWDKDSCNQLWQDFVDFYGSEGDKKEKYFLGTIVVYRQDDEYNDGKEKLYVIDGQQRLTSLSLLVKAFQEIAGTYGALGPCLKVKDPVTDELKNEPRIISRALEDDKHQFEQVILGNISSENGNPFLENLQLFKNQINEWWREKGQSSDELHSLITAFLDQLALLPIECDGEDDALKIFETLNNRGKPLGDPDIFKSKLYRFVDDDKKHDFISDWNDLNDHGFLFRMYMHVLRAKDDKTGKEIALRTYFQQQGDIFQGWQSVMQNLRLYNCIQFIEQSETLSPEIKAWWTILKTYPNHYWKFPLGVFIHEYGKYDEGEISLSAERAEDLLELIQETAKYTFLKGVVHNAVNTIKDTIFRVCADIGHDRDYIKRYREDGSRDIPRFSERYQNPTRSYRNGLVLIGAYLNPGQDPEKFVKEFSDKVDIEHILPQKGDNYAPWNDEEHKRDLDRLGNLVPLKKKLNIAASNEYFGRKQKEYRKSKIQDACDLAAYDEWTPNKLQARHEQITKRLENFFCYSAD